MLLTVAKVTTLNEVLELAWSEATSWVGQLEWPQEVAVNVLVEVVQTSLKTGAHTWLA